MIRSIEFDIVTKSEANQRFASRAGMFAKSNRVQKQRAAVRDVLAAHHTAPRLFVNVSADPIAEDARVVTVAQLQAMLGATKPNRITVRLTRIAPGELDDDNLRGALKAVRDAIAAWIGTNDRDPLIAWEYGQERAGQHVYRVRVDITDLAPGEPRKVVLAETTSEGRAAKSRIKRLTTRAAKGATNVQTKATPTTPEAFRAASHRRLRDGDEGTVRRNGTLQPVTSSGRAAAEAAWSKATGKPAATAGRLVTAAVAAYGPGVQPEAEALAAMRAQARSVRCPHAVEGVECAAIPGQPCRVVNRPEAGARSFEYGVHEARARAAGLPPYPTVEQLNAGVRAVKIDGSGKVAAWEWQSKPLTKAETDAVEREMKGCGMKRGRDFTRAGNELAPVRPKPDGDPGEERPARDLAPCTTCGVAIGLPCILVVPGAPHLPLVHGVHEARAKAAGINGVRTPPRAPTNGTRKVVPPAGPKVLQAWAALPWASCKGCGGRGGLTSFTQADTWLTCGLCEGSGAKKLTRWAALDGADPATTVRMRVPEKHVAEHGQTITLTRTRGTVPGVGEAWIYETER